MRQGSLGVDGNWIGVRDGDPRAVGLFRRHYSYRRKRVVFTRGANQFKFVGPGERIVLMTADCLALFVWYSLLLSGAAFRLDAPVIVRGAPCEETLLWQAILLESF